MSIWLRKVMKSESAFLHFGLKIMRPKFHLGCMMVDHHLHQKMPCCVHFQTKPAGNPCEIRFNPRFYARNPMKVAQISGLTLPPSSHTVTASVSLSSLSPGLTWQSVIRGWFSNHLIYPMTDPCMVYMLTYFWGYINRIHGTPYIAEPWIRHGYIDSIKSCLMGKTCLSLFQSQWAERRGGFLRSSLILHKQNDPV